jgi:hypothetical protein
MCLLLLSGQAAWPDTGSISTNKKELIDILLAQKLRPLDKLVEEIRSIALKVATESIEKELALDSLSSEPALESIVEGVVNDAVENDFRHRFMDELYAIHDRYFTEKELEEITRFNDTQAGRKMIEAGPLIARDIGISAKQAIVTLGPVIVERLHKRIVEEGVALPRR